MQVTYRSVGLGVYAVAVRFATMPLEKLAMIMNSSQVSGSNQASKALKIVFKDGFATPYRTVGPASVAAWFFQYSVMGFIFQASDTALSKVFGVERICYGDELMEPPAPPRENVPAIDTIKQAGKCILAPILAGSIEAAVANRAEGQRFWGIEKQAKIEKKLKWNALARQCGPGFVANANRNVVMSSTSFVLTPVLYQKYYPQEEKGTTTLLWFGMGMNIFFGNVIAITQQALWGRALDHAASGGGRNIHYGTVIKDGMAKEGPAAFFTPQKWFARVLMNAPIQGTMPFFYNGVLPMGEAPVVNAMAKVYRSVFG